MALQVWLPLNGNLNNNGINSITPSNIGSVGYTTSGKLGKAALITTDGLAISLAGFMSTASTYANYTLAAWIYLNSTATNHSASILSSGDWNATANLCCFALYSYNNGYTKLLVPNRTGWNTGIELSTPVTLNKWYHILITYNGTTTKAYINGEYVGSYDGGGITPSSLTNNLYIGAATYYSGFTLKGNLNDIRIYDEVISEKEIKELAKGLVIHYPFNDPYIESTTNLVSSFDPSFNTYSVGTSLASVFSLQAGGTVTVASNTYGVSKCLNYTPTSNGRCYFTLGTSINKTYTISAYVYCATATSATNMRLERLGGDYSWTADIATYTNANLWLRLSITVTNTSNTTFYIFFYGLANTPMHISNILIEEKDHASCFTVGTRTTTTDYDTSGYKNDAVLSTISPILNSNSPRNNSCYYFDTTSTGLKCTTIPTNSLANSYTFSWWGKAPSYSSLMYWGFSDGNRLNLYHGLIWNIGDGDANPFYTPNTTTTVAVPSADTWHHFVITGDGNTSKYYLDGLLYGIANTYRPVTGTTILINGWDTGSSYKCNGYISDFRIYSTCLTADDIKLLYNSSIEITNNGSLVTLGEVIEV